MKNFILPIIFLMAGLVSIVTFNLIGAQVAPDGKIIAPFFLIPTATFLIFIGFFLSIVALVKTLLKSKKSR